MTLRLHPHAAARLAERGATEAEAIATIETGETYPAKHGRTAFRRNFRGPWTWRNRTFATQSSWKSMLSRRTAPGSSSPSS